MIVMEQLAKAYLARYGVSVPRGSAAATPAAAGAIAAEWGGSVAIKAQVPSGKRGQGGGILFAATPEECEQAAARLLGSQLLGFRVEQVLVEEKVQVARELYVGWLVNASNGELQLIWSLAGGMDVENAAPGAVRTLSFEPHLVLPTHRVARLLKGNGVDEDLVQPLAFAISALHRMFIDLDLVQIEVNPLAVLDDHRLVALDCKMEVDDNSFGRHPDFAALHRQSLSSSERRAVELGVSFVPLDGDVGVIASGAGLGMATLDLLRRAGLQPADFLDTGGGITRELMQGAVELVLGSGGASGLLINLYGGINPMIAAAEGISAAVRNLATRRPVVVKLLGNSQEEAWQILEAVGVTIFRTPQTEVAVERLAAMLRENHGHPA